MLKKRITSIFLSIFIVIGVVASDYLTVMAVDIPTAFWGTLEYSRAFFTAMQTGGALDRGINFEDFTKSTQRQWMDLAPKVMEAYQLFCFYKEKVVVSAEHPDWTMEQINSEAVTRSFKLKDDFENNAIRVSTTTGKITLKDWGYWQEFCHEFSDVAKGGNIGSSDIGENTPVNANVINLSSLSSLPAKSKQNLGKNTFVYNDLNFVNKFDWVLNENRTFSKEMGGVDGDRIKIPFVCVKIRNNGDNYTYWNYLLELNVRILTQEIIAIGMESYGNDSSDNINGYVNYIIDNTDCPVIVGNEYGYDDLTSYFNQNGYQVLSVSAGGQQALDWQYKAQEALDDSEAGSSIKKGNSAQKTKTVVREGSVPIKRSSLKEEEQEGTKVVSGEIGWDIPNSKVIEGTIANPAEEDEEIRQIGVIDVPAEDIIDRPEEDDIVIPADTPIVVPEDEVIDGPVEPIPIVNIFEMQYGPFYPSAMQTLEEFFPFCIPFDIYYCIQKFNVEPGEAPILHLAIPIPRQLQSTIGVTYDINVDLNDYVLLRDIIRYFILLSFIVGLMTLTRDIIRG